MMSTRPRPVTPPSPQPATTGIEVGLLPLVASIVGALVVCGVIGGTLWLTRDGADEPVATHTDPTQPAGALSGTPELSASLDGQTLVFTFGYDDLQDGDHFVVRTGGQPEQVTGTPMRVDGTELRVGIAAGEQQCATVQVVRGPQRSGWSKVQCETVRSS